MIDMSLETDDLIDKLSLSEARLNRGIPVNLKEEDRGLFESEVEKTIGAVTPFYFGFGVITPIGALLKILKIKFKKNECEMGGEKWVKNFIKSLASILLVRRVVFKRRLVFITSPFSSNFFHWFLDVLPKIQHTQSVGCMGISSRWKFVIPANCNMEFVKKSLSIFDVDCVFGKKNELIVVGGGFVIADLAPTGNYRRDNIIDLSQRLRFGFRSDNQLSSPKKRVYISRKNAIKRKIINEIDLIPALESFGFFIADFDVMSFDEQLACMLDAEVLVSLHGAGLTHMLWMQPKSKVLEIRARGDSHNNCYFSLASDLNHKYYYALADKLDDRLITQESDFYLNVSHFKTVLNEMSLS
jgi:hypothetical protein